MPGDDEQPAATAAPSVGPSAPAPAVTKQLPPCPICRKPAGVKCSKCRTRRYCGAVCQKEDWKEHKNYCFAKREKCKHPALAIAGLKIDHEGMREELGIYWKPWDYVLERAEKRCPGGSKDPEVISDTLDPMYRAGVIGPQSTKPVPSGLFQAQRVMSLPFNPVAQWTVSYQTQGLMERKTGALQWDQVCNDNIHSVSRAAESMFTTASRRPTAEDASRLLYWAMLHPSKNSGTPHRPCLILFAHRWGKGVVDALQPELNKAGIVGRLESWEDAVFASSFNNTHPMGLNWAAP